MVAYDIHFYSVENPEKEVEPALEVKVEISVTDAAAAGIPEEFIALLTITHIFDEGGAEVVKAPTVFDLDDETEGDGEYVPGDDEVIGEFDTGVFSTFTITWRSGGRTVTVHYVDESGNELDVSNTGSGVFGDMYANSSSPAFLIYDIDGYEYSYTYRNTNTNGNRIAPLLTKNGYNRWQYMGANNTNTTELTNGDDIYVVYNKKADPTTGGTPKIDNATSSDWPQGDDTPQFYKSSTNNGNGKNTVSLSISGGEKEYEKSTKANVIVVFDRSGSMGGNNIWRLNTAKTAVKDMADTLLNGDITGVKMALVSFSTTASTVQGFTDNYSTFTSAVDDLTAEGGTNWEQALQVANRMAVDSDAATFVVFVTDGDPTFRVSRGDVTNSDLDMYNSNTTYQYYRINNVFGQGNADGQGRNFDFAAEEVKSILANNKTFYAIGVSSDVTKVQNLVDEAGGGTAYLATDSDALEEAFANITQSIKTTLGFGDIEITDGITELSNVEMKVMQEVDPNSFKYYKVTSSGQAAWDPTSEGASLASYNSDTGAVTWNMGDSFQLEDGVTYMVTFEVWPSQEAYDLIAQLNNGEKVYAAGQANSITDEERAQIVELAAPTATSQGSYTLKTNTDSVSATYSQTSSTGETVTVSGETDITATYHEGTIQNMDLTSQLLTIRKTFEDDLTAGEDRDTEVTLVLKRKINDNDHDFADYNAPGTTSPNIVLNEGNNWTYSFYVAPGFIVDDEVLEKGYQFTVTEPDIDYHYDLIEEIVNPMVVNGTLTLIGDTDSNQSLTAINRVKSGIDIAKHVYDTDGTTEIYPETEFTITGRLLGPDGQPYTWQDGDDVNASGAYHKYDKDGNRIVYKGHFADSSNISFTLKAGESIRFINVPEGCTFEFTESTTGMDALGYEWMSTTAVTQHRTGPGEDFVTTGDVQPVVSGQTATLFTGVVGNKQYAITYGNKRTIELPDVELVKVDKDDNTKKLNEAEFTLYSDAELTTPVTVDGNGNTISIKTGNKEGSAGPDGWYHIGLLPAGTYYLVETAQPDDYVLDETPVIITVTKGTDSYTVTATKNGTSVISGPTDGLYTITVDNTYNITEADATKAWVNADGTTAAPANATVVFTLYADGTATNYTVTLDGTPDETVPTVTGGYESTAWNASFVNLTKYREDGTTPIVYTIAETTGYPGYTASTTEPVASGGTITNTQEATTAYALKAWVNADGTTTAPTGASVVYTLYSDGEATSYTVTLDGTVDTAPAGTAGYESEAWKALFINLPKYQAGTTTEIVYTIAETTTYPGYTASTTEPVASGETITNTQEATTANALKEWKNADGSTTAPDGGKVTYTLYADGVATSYTVELDGTADTAPTGTAGYESAAWKAEFVNLPKFKDGTATEIVYTIAETTTYPGYTPSTTAPVASGETITNTQEATEADAKKAWVNADGTTAAPTNATVVFTLYADGAATTYTVTLDGTADATVPTVTGGYESEGWTATFVNLPKYHAGTTTEFVYTIAETTTYPGYTASTTAPVASGSTITNTQEATEANALKAWKNADGSTTAPDSGKVTYTLYADGVATSYTVELDGAVDTEPTGTAGYESEAWKATFVNLPKYKAGTTTEIVYTIAETTTYPGYTASTTEPVASGETITNTQEATTANALKEWKNADGSTTAPDGGKVTYTLYADGVATSYTVELNGTADAEPTGTAGYESEAWKATFVNLPMYQAGTTTEIVYTIAETTGYPGYTASTTEPVGSGSTITNTQDETSANALKAWVNADGTTTAPQGGTVTYTLYADGTATNYTVTLDGTADTAPETTGGYESEAWKAEFVHLQKYQSGTTTEIVYTIAETKTYPGYTASMTDPVASGEKITNTQEGTEANALKAWVNADGTTEAPEGATVVYTLYADGTATEYTVTLDGEVDEVPEGAGGYESEAWKAKFINLPKYKIVDGAAVEIEYKIAETTTYPGYTASTTEPVASGSTIINTQEEDSVNALKAWKNADGTTEAPEGATVVYTLYADGTATEYTVTLDGTADETVPTVTGGYESEAWKAEFVHLPKYKIVKGEGGTETNVAIVYTIAETTTYPGYTASTTEPVVSGSTITNEQESTTADATKAWKNADGTTAAPTNATVVFTLYADDEATEYTVTLDGTADEKPAGTGGYESEAWKAEFVNLPKYKIVDGEAVEIVYTIGETTTYPGYTVSTTDAVASGGTITNTQVDIDVYANKAWKNADGSTTAPEGATVVFTLFADGTATNYTVTLDGTADTEPAGTAGYESEAWKAMFVNLPKYKIVDGEAVEIVYTIGETTTYPGYTVSTTAAVASGETITNTQEDTEAYALKVWENADGSTTAPEGATVVFKLYADDEATEYTVTLDGTVDTAPTVTGGYEGEAWKAMFVNLPKYKVGTTTEIVYTIAETTGYEGYKVSTTEPVASGETITNTQLSAEIKLLKIGDGDQDTKLDGAEFELYSVWNGAGAEDNVKAKNIYGEEVGTITTADGGVATIGGLLPGTYYLVETKAPDGYNMLTDPIEINILLVDEDPGFTVSYIQKDYSASSAAGTLKPDDEGAYLITVSNPSGNELPHTGASHPVAFTIAGLTMVGAVGAVLHHRKKEEEE